jgi:hypothetical protein
MSFRHWQYTFVNGLPLEEQRAAYDTYVVPESRRLSRVDCRLQRASTSSDGTRRCC